MINYLKKCKTTQGGVKEFYLFQYEKYNRSEINDDKMALTKFPEGDVYKFECNGTYNQQSSVEGGAFFFDQTVSIQLSEVYDVLDLDIYEFLCKRWRVILKTNNDQLLMFGVYNGMECKASNASGGSKAEFNGFSLDFTGKELKTALTISSLDDFNFIIKTQNILNAFLNFKI